MKSRSAKVSAFTLIELMISIALVLALMIGVNYVFSSVGQATGLTQAMSRVTREMQGAQGVISRDFNTADMANAPFVVIRSSATPAFRDRTDYSTALVNTNPLIDVNPGTGVPFTHEITSVNDRVHRTDVLLFFSRDKFARQTGGGTFNNTTQIQPYLGDMNGQEAMIWYGHLWLPDDTGAFPAAGPLVYPINPATYPGFGTLATNPNNFVSNQWFLGRAAILLQEPDPLTGKVITKRAIKDALGNPTGTYNETAHWHIKDNSVGLDPLQFSSTSDPTGFTLEQSRYDLAGTSMEKMRGKSYSVDWWTLLMTVHRFQARPFVLGAAGSRLSPADVALQAPIFLSNCSQFIVEYAGDFIAQTPTGQLDVSRPTDDTIDFFYDSRTQTRRIRWYGLPRDTSGHFDTVTNEWISAPDERIRADEGDVVPLRDLRGGTLASFERKDYDQSTATEIGVLAAGAMTDYIGYAGRPLYTCAWGPSDTVRPSMFRILIAIDDPNGRFADPLMFEYVFRVP